MCQACDRQRIAGTAIIRALCIMPHHVTEKTYDVTALSNQKNGGAFAPTTEFVEELGSAPSRRSHGCLSNVTAQEKPPNTA